MKRLHATTAATLVLIGAGFLGGCATECPDEESGVAARTGDWLGETPPGDEPVIFAPGFLSTGLYDRDLAATPDGDELYSTVVLGNYDTAAILVARRVDGVWSEPVIAPWSGQYKDFEPAISPDGQRFYFVSFRPADGEGEPAEHTDIWVMDRESDGWGAPRNLGAPVNDTGSEYFPSVTRDGTLYFTREGDDRTAYLYRAARRDDGFAEPEKLGPGVNSTTYQYNGYVAPDESYLIFATAARDDTLGRDDYYVSFRNADGSWTGPLNLGPRINTAQGLEYSPYVSLDGRWFFFMAARSTLGETPLGAGRPLRELQQIQCGPGNGYPNIWWVDARFLDDLRPS
jgi:hypothetical protein